MASVVRKQRDGCWCFLSALIQPRTLFPHSERVFAPRLSLSSKSFIDTPRCVCPWRFSVPSSGEEGEETSQGGSFMAMSGVMVS